MNAHPTKLIEVDEFTAVHRNTLRGFCKVTLPSGMILSDVGIHLDGNRAWAMPASKPMLGSDGAALRDAANKIRYTAIVSFTSKEVRDRFSAGVIEALKAKFPEALA